MVELTSSKARSKLGTVKECQEMIQRSLQTPMVKFLMEHMEKSGCKVGDNFIRAVPCNKQMAGGFIRGKGIIVCSNYMRFQDEVTQTVIHELIHAYDDCRAANLDFRNCAHHVCSEIRANNLSGDCHFKRELLRSLGKIHRDIREQIRSEDTLVDLPFTSTSSQLPTLGSSLL
ncbi:hypothetical protein DITRI_Ditri09bG0017400 [Diplodiscus trichospermus]